MTTAEMYSDFDDDAGDATAAEADATRARHPGALIMDDPTGTEIAAAPPKRGPGRPRGLGRVPGSGRQRGTPNKKTAEARELLLGLKCDPITGMARIAMNKHNSAELRGRMYSELAQYLWPKRKAIEVTGEQASPFVLAIQLTR